MKRSLSATFSSTAALALLALSFTFGGSYVVRAEDPETLLPALQDMVYAPIMRAVQGFEQRLASLGATVASFTESFTAQRITTEQLCISDSSGAQTCITKSQLDALLRNQAHAEADALLRNQAHAEADALLRDQARAEASQPSIAEREINTPPPAEAVKIATITDNEPATSTVAKENSQNDRQPEQTGTVTLSPSVTELYLVTDTTIPVHVDLP